MYNTSGRVPQSVKWRPLVTGVPFVVPL